MSCDSKLGKPNELFTAVRFFDNVAYAVTFERTDPFYVLDMKDPYNLDVLAEVEISGFSTYLHSMNDKNCLILAIGQEADENGRVLGLQLTVFDACGIEDGQDVTFTRHTIEQEENVYSDSSATWDVKAVRYNRETGRLIIPVDIYSYEYNEGSKNSFHGFKTYIVTEKSITESCSIETGNENDKLDGCYSCLNSFAPRAMIFGGDVTTTKGHFVTSTDLNTCKQVWQFSVAVTEEKEDDIYGCCGYW